jgi:hypothetical protein
MASIAEILPRFWANQEWSIDEDNFLTLDWAPGNTLPKPTEGEIRAHSDEVDALLADEAQRDRQQRALADAPDYLLKAIEIMIDGMIEIRRVVNDIRSTAVGAAHTGSYTTWDATVVSKMAALKQKVTDLRNVP